MTDEDAVKPVDESATAADVLVAETVPVEAAPAKVAGVVFWDDLHAKSEEQP